MPSQQLQETNNPRALSAFGIGGNGPTPGASGVQEVTDPETLKRFAETPTAEEAEPLNYGRDVGTYGAFVSGFASDENELKRYLASKLFPGEPIDRATKRFGMRERAVWLEQ